MTEPDTELADRIHALSDLLEMGNGIIEPPIAARAASVIAHATERLRHGTDFTIVAMAGATGSGKSSLFNRIVGEDIAPVGITRPTTADARAAVFGPGAAGPILDWLGVKHRHGIDTEASLNGLVLIDLPDHDSVEVSHRMQVDRFVGLVDLLVWVLDPQKYADQVLHERYLRHLSAHGDVMAFALNQVDLLPAAGHAGLESDARRLLAADGLPDPTIVLTSTVTGLGLDELRALLAERIERRTVALSRIDADLRSIATDLAALRSPPGTANRGSGRSELAAGLADAAGATAVEAAVANGFRHDAAIATGWPFTRWVKRMRRHPLRRLSPSAPGGKTPSAIPIDQSRLDLAIKTYADQRAAGAPPVWARRLRDGAMSNRAAIVPELGARIKAVAGQSTAAPRWFRAFGSLQRMLAFAATAGALWLVVLLVLDWLRIPTDQVTPEVNGWPIPTVLLLGGIILGIVMAAFARFMASVGARRRGRLAAKRIAASIDEVAVEYVAAPVDAELSRWQTMATAVSTVAG